jgi:hypothetical protein
MPALYIIAGIILFIVFVLSIPVEMAFDLHVHEGVKSRVRVGWLFGLIWKDMGRRKKKPKEKKEKKKRSMKTFFTVLRTEGVPSRLLKLAKQIIRGLKIRQLDAHFRFGLDDPADTGILYAIVWPALAFCGSYEHVSMSVEPSFDEPTLEGSMNGRIRFFPIQVVGTVLRFAFSPTGIRVAKSMLVSRWK